MKHIDNATALQLAAEFPLKARFASELRSPDTSNTFDTSERSE